MHDVHSAPTIIVGIDGSQAALGAAVWAVDEAAERDIPLKLVYVVYPPDLPGAAADAALSDARRAVEVAAELVGKPVKIETEVLRGNPLTTLIELSRSVVMVCVGAIGIGCACHRAGSTAAALAGSARCPVAVIRRRDVGRCGPRSATGGYIVADVDAWSDNRPDNNAVLRWAVTEARLRGAPLRVMANWASWATGDQPT